MALVTANTMAWSAPRTLASDETWFVLSGAISYNVGAAAPAAGDGIPVVGGQGVEFLAGTVVRYRCAGLDASTFTIQVA